MLHAARGVIKRHRLDLRMLPEKVSALVERHGMRIDAANVAHLHSRGNDEVMHNPQTKFLLNENLARQQKIEVLGHRTRE